MKKPFILLLSLVSLVYSCQPIGLQNSAIHGLASTIQLQSGVTEVHLSDYFLSASWDSLRWPAGITAETIDSSTVLLSGQPKEFVSSVAVYFGPIRYDIPVCAASTQTVQWTIEGMEQAGSVHLFGSFNAWNREALQLERSTAGLKAELELKAGQYEYKLMVDGKEKTDPSNADSVSNGMGGFNSVLRVEESGEPPVQVRALTNGKNFISLNAIPDDQELLVLWENHLLNTRKSFENGQVVHNIPIPEPAFRTGRSHIRVFCSRNEQKGNDVLIPLERGNVVRETSQLNRSDWQKSTMYFIMIDRFLNGDPSNDRPVEDPQVHPKANFYGGDIAGIDQKIEDGFFRSLGMNTLWLSPFTKNPEDAWGLWDKGGVTTKFSGYHGYWPISNVVPDGRFGRPEVIRDMLGSAHEQEMNVLLDYVANHVHQSHPIYQEHPEWATDLYLPDGSLNTERWDEHRLTTWFDTFMPTLDLRRQEIVDPMTDSALVWVTEYAFDGFRHDATKHISERYWRTLTSKIKRALPERRIYQIGETYGSPDLIASYLGSGMLDAQFDFNVYDAAVSAFSGAEEVGPASRRLAEKLLQSLQFYGHHNLMGYISGNQDRSRFISIASGDVSLGEDQKLAGWTRNIPVPSEKAYQRLALLHAFNFAVPGIPVVYYGDEYGLHGGGDPDNRKMMRFDGYTDLEQALVQDVQKLAELRGGKMALLYGATQIEATEEGVLIIRRSYFDQEVLILINPTEEPFEYTLEDERLSLFGSQMDKAGNQTTVRLAPLDFDYLINP